jgi:hypothetical protein
MAVQIYSQLLVAENRLKPNKVTSCKILVAAVKYM